jgi:hypothetical protein
MEFLFFLAFLVFIIAGANALSFVAAKKRRKNWASVVQSLRLEYFDDVISGRFEAFRISVSITTRSHGRSQHHVTVFKADLEAELPVGLSIVSEYFGDPELGTQENEDVLW